VRKLLARDPRLWFSVSATTRPRREVEVEGRDYLFLDRAEFDRMRDAGGFLEWFEVYGDLYGTPLAPVENHLAGGDDVVLEIDVQGALAVKEAFPDALLVFVKAPSRVEQRRRLLDRGQDDPEAIERRLAQAEEEEGAVPRFDAVVVNDDADRAAGEVAAILAGQRRATPPS
jgi:guanylate kinase